MYNFPISPQVKLSSLVFRTLSGVIGGTFGTVIVFIGIFLGGSIVQPVLSAAIGEEGVHPLFIFLAIILIFLSLLVSNLATCVFLTYANREKYNRLISTLTQVFVVNVILFLVALPLYLLVSAHSLAAIGYLAGIQLILGVLTTVLAMEVLAGSKHIILNLYSSILAIFSALLVIAMIFLTTTAAATSLLVFIAIPLVWGFFAFWGTVAEMVYQWFYSLYGSDPLCSETSFGEDYGERGKEEKEEESPVKSDDVTEEAENENE
ncbi:MAG TPA: hypothetical protein ENI70_00830 [Candidatus Peregrinibacteria bacterium]|nr:hypothetical protein [Candidatus Peregrinibacteria bacterium]